MVHVLVDGVVRGVVHNVVDKNIPIVTESAYLPISFTRLPCWDVHFSFGFTRDSQTAPMYSSPLKSVRGSLSPFIVKLNIQYAEINTVKYSIIHSLQVHSIVRSMVK